MPGSHGSLTKAGKVRQRNQHMKKPRYRKSRRQAVSFESYLNKPIERDYKPKDIPRIRNRRNYTRRIIKRTEKGQQSRKERWQR